MMKMKKSSILLLAMVFMFMLSTQVQAANQFYSVIIETSDLVLIDADAETVEVIGPLGIDVGSLDMASFDGRLFVLNSVYDYVTKRYTSSDLLELNPLTGEVISSAPLTYNGNPVYLAEGLTAVGNQLKVGFRATGLHYSSNMLGDIGLDGVVSNATSYSHDFDGLGADGERVYWVDAVSSTVYIYSFLSPKVTLWGRYPTSVIGPNDISITSAGMFMIDNYHVKFHHLGSKSIDLSSYGNGFQGIAAVTTASGVPVPTPCDEIILDMQDEIDSLTAQLEDKDLIIADRDAQILTLESDLAQALADLQQTNQTILDQQTQINNLTNQIADLSVQIVSLEGQVAARDAEIVALKAERDGLVVDLAALQAQIDSLNATLSALQAAFAGLAGDPDFVIPGDTPAEQIQNLVDAISDLPPGQRRNLIEDLTGQ